MTGVYDFESEKAAGRTSAPGPARALMYLEVPRWVGEYAASRAIDLVTPVRDVGRDRPVLVLPGFSANDVMTGRLRSHLRSRGFRVHGWRLGRNHGLTERLVDGLEDRFTSLAKEHDEPVSIVGWSFGGLLARWLAHEHSGDVRQIVCLGSPWRAEGERTRATGMFERSRQRHGISDRARAIVERARGPVPVPTTAIYSKTDGIVPWAGCRVDDATFPAPAENIEVLSSHVGMVANPLVLAAVVDRLTQDPADWRPFSWRSLLPGVHQ